MAPPPLWPSANHELVYGWQVGSGALERSPPPFTHAPLLDAALNVVISVRKLGHVSSIADYLMCVSF